jgi:hypothetical protein
VATVLASLTYTIDMRVAGVAEKARRTYAIGKGLARDETIESSSLAFGARRTSGGKGRGRRRRRRSAIGSMAVPPAARWRF